MEKVRAKKHLGQHFLTDLNIAQKIVEALPVTEADACVLEIGPGMGVLTQYLLETQKNFFALDIDEESVTFLKKKYSQNSNQFLLCDFLETDLFELCKNKINIIGNFPYNISTQIMFKVLENRTQVNTVVGMFQKEVAERIAEKEGSKTYGILSVLLQAFYKIEYLFTVHEHVFSPAPKVKSAVIRLTRNKTEKLNCNEELFFKVVKTSFNQRRKTLRNSLKPILKESFSTESEIFNKRPEQLNVREFIELTRMLE